MDQGQDVAAVMIDLSKAFDTVNHDLLADKLAAYRICGGELRWFKDYLSNRRQHVIVNGAESDWNDVTKGVLQATILHPLLFVLFMDDLLDVVQDCSIRLYADNIMLYVSHRDLAKLSKIIERDLYNISRWITSNSLKMNVVKTQLMVLNRKSKDKKVEQIQVSIDGTELNKQSSVKYLGVLVDNDLT